MVIAKIRFPNNPHLSPSCSLVLFADVPQLDDAVPRKTGDDVVRFPETSTRVAAPEAGLDAHRFARAPSFICRFGDALG
jgi:hypothetical protein